ncbi:hypothetical protein LCGC14_2703910, partial [marine sediment metagenome]
GQWAFRMGAKPKTGTRPSQAKTSGADMNGITFQQIEDLDKEEAAQMKRYVNNSLRKRMARAERMIEANVSETEIELELERTET